MLTSKTHTMASSNFHILFFFLALFIPNSFASLTLPITKDPKTLQYYTSIKMGSKKIPINVIMDLSSGFLWFGCDSYTSSTYKPIPCDSSQCGIAKGVGCVGCNGPYRPGCTNNTCGATPYNPFQDVLISEGFGTDILYANDVGVSQMTFSCMGNAYLKGLANGVTGMLGLAKTDIAFYKQASSKLNLPPKFAICLPSSSRQGRLFIGGGEYSTISVMATPFVTNPVSTAPIYTEGDPSDEYFINVNSISVAGKTLPVKSSYFSINRNGVGGTKISTITNFTVLHSSIYRTLTRAFVEAAIEMKIKRVASVAPFTACFDGKSVLRTKTGPDVPRIDISLPGNAANWNWTIYGANSMIEVKKNVLCFAFLNGGSKPRTSIVIGGHQLEDNLVEFDLSMSLLRYSSSLLQQGKSCSRL